RSSLTTWLTGICLRVAADWRRKPFVRRETTLDEAPERANSGETALRQIALRQARTRLDALLDQLDDDKRAVFVLFELEQQSMADVARAVDVPVQTAYARLYAARRFIEGHLQLQESA
ncbi:MAG: sigma-70 family RNA polymerase sigma factor, partial [Myxococcus sp.]|nr:sigma-70 family RNA polymerase sigma factor [Myxococcus sp.]